MSKKNKGMDIVTKMTLIGGLGLISILIVVGIMALAMKDKGGQTNTDKQVNNQSSDVVVNNDLQNIARSMGVVKEVDVQNDELAIVDVDSNEHIVLKIDGAVDIKDEYGTLLSLAQLVAGDIVETKYDKNTMRPDNVHIAAQTWERKNVQNIIIDADNKTIQIANDIYKYTDDLVTTYNGAVFDLSRLESVDVVTVKGYKDVAWSITVEKTHGYIELKNQDKFIGGTIDIGKTTYDVEASTKITVPIGVHNIAVSKEGMSPFITQVMVDENQVVEVDLGAGQAETGVVSFNIVPSDVTLYINDEVKDFSQPIILDYGTYQVRVEKENYVPWESTLVVNQATMVVNINMNEKPTYIHVDNPTGCSLYIDGNYIGVIPIEAPIDKGVHSIMLTKDGYYSKTHAIQIDTLGQDAYYTFPDLIKMPEQTTDHQTTGGQTTDTQTTGQTTDGQQGTTPTDSNAVDVIPSN